jgi:cysteine peptidase C11 family protein
MHSKSFSLHITIFFAILTVAPGSALCGLHNPKETTAPALAKAKWTVMLYMNGDNSLDPFAILDFEEMAKIKYDSHVNVVIQLDRKQLAKSAGPTDENWSETRRFLMRQGLRATRSDSLQDFSEESNMGDPATLAEFVNWARKKFPAERYMLIIWSHGDGWRRQMITEPFFTEPKTAAKALQSAVTEAEEMLQQEQLTDAKLASLNLTLTSVEPQYRTISEDETNNSDKLYVREIQDALEGVFGDRNGLDVIGFDACLMQMIETGYAMRKVAGVMVGSEELEPSEGWRYDCWLQALVDNPNMDGIAIGKIMVETYKETFEHENPTTTLSAINLSDDNIDRLAEAVSLLARELIINLDTALPVIKEARANCNVYAPRRRYHGVDLYRFCSQLDRAGVNAQLRNRAKKVMTLIDSLVINNYAGRLRQDNFGSHGLAIYFPANNEAYELDPYRTAYRDDNEDYVVQFVKDQLWDNFLHAYFKRV